MRFILAGLLLLFIPTWVFAQASGEVQSIGFGNGYFRPNCWTPMVVRLRPDTADSANYEIEVWQHDLDGDRPIYTRPIVLNGSAQASVQKFWTYFLPQPTDTGLPSNSLSNPGGSSIQDPQKDLQVFLCLPDHKQIAKLPITSTLQNVDPNRNGTNLAAQPRSTKLILVVSTNGTKESTLSSYNKSQFSVGAKEDVEVVNIRPGDLPEDPIGYEAVDAIVWTEGNPQDLSVGNLDTLKALKDYIRYGGHLVVCQSTNNWQEDAAFGDLMPVDVSGVATKTEMEPLLSMAQPLEADPFQTAAQSWSRVVSPFQMARATARPGSVVEKWIDWKQDGSNSDSTPYIARKAYGLGQVTWVAQPLTTETSPTNSTGWTYVWDKVMGWRSDAYVLPSSQKPNDSRIIRQMTIFDKTEHFADLGYPLVNGLNLNSKANWLILLAIVFFIIYWVVAGPGGYAYLATRKRQGWSWFFFGLSAMGATLITFLVVRLVLRGPPEVRHLSFVRIPPAGQAALVHSRFGLYIPRDGIQKIALDDTAPTSISYLSPFAEHPQQLGEVGEFPSPTEYFVPARDLKSDTQPQLNVGYRRSLKKFQARWVGTMDARIAGSVALDPQTTFLPLSGVLTNSTNVDLNDVYLAFNVGGDKDWLIYVPNWPRGTTYDIKRDFSKHYLVGRDPPEQMGLPGDKKILSDELASNSAKIDPKYHGWLNYWYGHYRRTSGDDPNLNEEDLNFVFPIVSLFDRLPAMPNTLNYNDSPPKSNGDRIELYNRGATSLNASGCIATGQLVILASAKGPLPIPVEVDDEKMTGTGTVFYQFILPVDRGNVDAPTTRPSDAK